MQSKSTHPFVLHTLLGIACLILVLVVLPEDTALWRKIFAGILSITFGHHLARAILPTNTRAERIKLWLECLAFPALIFAFLILPTWQGWLLFAVGFFWRSLVGNLFIKP
ncbi:MAG: hypothetical protein QE570_16750 [Verrucomicrobiota bacterium]|jgi:hypothetical protein|nr:hypothetical protein [Verrucomicrobiota bacterium]